jgi:hypothetical protein
LVEIWVVSGLIVIVETSRATMLDLVLGVEEFLHDATLDDIVAGLRGWRWLVITA